MRHIGEDELDDIVAGAAILGTGGGGDPDIGKLILRLNYFKKHTIGCSGFRQTAFPPCTIPEPGNRMWKSTRE